MLFAVTLALLAGFVLSNQTPINTDLRNYAGSPIASGLISFLIGTLFLGLVVLLTGGSLLPSLAFIGSQPAWIWLGGVLGAIYLTSNILLFPRLGALQTVVLPIFGQLLMGTVIDSLGLFASPKIPLSLMRALGLLLLLVGVIVTVVLPNLLAKKQEVLKEQPKMMIGWQIWAVVIGMLGATQIAINGHLGTLLHNSAQASFISFLVGTVLIFIVVLVTDKRLPQLGKLKKAKIWNYLGGILGALYVLTTVIVAPQIGAGLTIMMALIGQILGGMLVQQFGWWRSPRHSVRAVQVFGVLLMLLAVVLIKLL